MGSKIKDLLALSYFYKLVSFHSILHSNTCDSLSQPWSLRELCIYTTPVWSNWYLTRDDTAQRTLSSCSRLIKMPDSSQYTHRHGILERSFPGLHSPSKITLHVHQYHQIQAKMGFFTQEMVRNILISTILYEYHGYSYKTWCSLLYNVCTPRKYIGFFFFLPNCSIFCVQYCSLHIYHRVCVRAVNVLHGVGEEGVRVYALVVLAPPSS